jgi:hypothetical protein
MASSPLSVLLLHGDAEARLLASAEFAIEAVFPGREVQLTRAWMTRPDWLDIAAPAPPASLRSQGLLADLDVRQWLAQPPRLVIFSFLPVVAVRALRHRSGGVFLAHRAVCERWSALDAAAVAAQCTLEVPLSPAQAASAFEPVINRLQEQGASVILTMAFRHVNEPLQHRRTAAPAALRELIRGANLEVARLSQRTGCFVLDLDRPLAQRGGTPLGADCFGGGEAAAELAVEELVALIADALPDELMPMEAQ